MTRALICTACLLLALPAAAQMAAPPPALADAEHYVIYDAYWPGPDGVELVTLYVVRHRQCAIEPSAAERFACDAADLDGDGAVGTSDFIECSKLAGTAAKACAAVVQAYWGQTCRKGHP